MTVGELKALFAALPASLDDKPLCCVEIHGYEDRHDIVPRVDSSGHVCILDFGDPDPKLRAAPVALTAPTPS